MHQSAFQWKHGYSLYINTLIHHPIKTLYEVSHQCLSPIFDHVDIGHDLLLISHIGF